MWVRVEEWLGRQGSEPRVQLPAEQWMKTQAVCRLFVHPP